MKKRAIVLAVLMGSTACAAPHSSPPVQSVSTVLPDSDPPISYAVRRGDNLYNLARFYMMNLGDYRIVQRLSRVRNPYRLRIGKTLTIPRSLLRSDPMLARVIAFRGAASIDGKAVALGTAVGEGGEIRTGPNASISVALSDGSTVTLPSQSLIRVARLRRYHLTSELDRLFRLETGRSETRVTPRTNGRDRFELRTPISVAAVRGTDFRVALLGDGQASTIEVLEGHVDFAGIGTEVMLDPNTGARSGGGTLIGPVPLLPPPEILNPTRVQSEPEMIFDTASLTGAAHYRVQISADAGGLDMLEEVVVDQPRATLPPLPNGDYFVRIAGIDANDLEGRPRVLAFDRHLNAVRGTLQPLGGRRYLFKWQNLGEGEHLFRFFLARADAPDRPVIDEPALSRKNLVITNLLPGDYVWRVQASEVASNGKRYANWSNTQTFTVAGKQRHTISRAKPPAS